MRTGGHTHAWYKGKRTDEYAWFGALANFPLLSTSAHTVAKQLWDAVRNGDPELVVGWPSKVLLAFQSMFPTLVAEGTALANRGLPDGTGEGDFAIPG